MKKGSFVHLHNHTHYSVLDGACRIKDMAQKCKDTGMHAVAITDHGNMFGAVNFYKNVLDAGIKPIIGLEAYVAMGSRKDKEAASAVGGKKGSARAHHMVLLAKNNTGYQNLMHLCSMGFLEGFYYKPRIDRELLEKYHEGLIASSACIKGELAHLILTDQYDKAKETADYFNQLFGPGNFYLELMNHGLDEELKNNEALIRMSREMGIPLIATNDSHYLNKDDALAQDVMVCIQTQKKLNDPGRFKFTTEELYFKTPAEMEKLFGHVPEALSNTLEVAEKCNVTMEFGKNKLPHFPMPAGYDDLGVYLTHLCREGLKMRYPKITPAIEERLEFELKTIIQMGFPGYFLITMDFMKEAKRMGIPVGPGRGSAAGSLVSYALEITNVDPLKYDLYFERFLNPHRISMPDIDIDFADRDRQKIIDYVINKWGDRNVSQIITFGTMAARGVIRDVARVLDVPYAEADKMAKLVPAGPKIKLKDAMEVKEFKELVASSELYGDLYKIASKLEGLVRNVGTHAAGVVIAPAEIYRFCPLYRSSTGDITTQFDMDGITDIGLLKMDFLGLRTLTVIADAIRHIQEHRSEFVDVDKIPLDDKATYELFAEGGTVGIFQFESTGMRDYLRKLKPTELADIIAMNALYRPGPMEYIDDYIHRKHGKQEVKFDHELLQPILKETYGIIVYQEQVMRIVSDLAGFSLAEADMLRRAMGKKKAALMEEYREKFLKGCAAKKIKKETANKIFDDMYKFSAYAFNKSHSTGYAIVAYQTAYLKKHYPEEFMAASLTSEMENTDRVVTLIDECKRMGIKILPPDINESNAEFTVVKKGIRFGLKAIKNVGQGAIESIIAAREANGRFRNLFAFCEQVDLGAVNKRVVESLILAGACDCLEGERWSLSAAVDTAFESAQVIQRDRKKGQTSLFDMGGGVSEEFAAPEIKLPVVEAWSSSDMLRREKELLGFYVSGHPLEKYQDDLQAFATHTVADMPFIDDGRDVRVGGIVLKVNEQISRNGKPYAFITFEDFSGAGEALVFNEAYEQYKPLMQKDCLVFFYGKASTKEKGNGKVIVNSCLPLQQLRKKMARYFIVTLNTSGLEKQALEDLKGIMQQHEGKCQVILEVKSPHHDTVRMRSRGISVNPTDKLLSSVRKAVGAENVRIR